MWNSEKEYVGFFQEKLYIFNSLIKIISQDDLSKIW